MRQLLSQLVTLGFLAATPSLVHAIDLTWDGGGTTSAWTEALNWNPDQVPGTAPGGPADRALFPNAAAKVAVISADIPTIDSIILSAVDGTGVGARLDQTGGNASLLEVDTTFRGDGGFFRIGEGGGSGTYNLSGGLMEADRVILGLNAGGVANFTMTNGTLRQRDVPNVNDASGNTWSGFAEDGGSTANVNISGGLLSFSARSFLGRNGVANITQTGGVIEQRSGELNLADTGTTTYNLSGGTLRTLNADTVVSIGQWDNGNATLNITGTGVADFASELTVAQGRDGFPTTGTLAVGPGGSVTIHEGINVGNSNTSVGNVSITGGTIRQPDVVDGENQQNWSRIGNNGTSNFNISAGTFSVDSRLHFGAGQTSISTITQTGGVVEARRHEVIIGDLGTVNYNISGGVLQTLQAGRPIAVGNWNFSNATLNVSGSAQVISAGNLTIAQVQDATFSNSGRVNQTGGLVRVAGDINMGINSPTAAGTYILNGGTLDMTGGNINKGPGTATFTFTNGRLQDLAAYNIGNMNHQGGVLAPGPSATSTPGTTTINGNYSIGAPGTLELQLFSLGSSDLLNVNGTVTLTGNLDLIPGPGLAVGNAFTILGNDAADSVTGTFAGKSGTFVEDGYQWGINYAGNDGNDVVVTVLSIVPEPTTATFAVIALGCLIARRRRQP